MLFEQMFKNNNKIKLEKSLPNGDNPFQPTTIQWPNIFILIGCYGLFNIFFLICNILLAD